MTRLLGFSILVTLLVAFEALFFNPGVAAKVDTVDVVLDFEPSLEPVYAEIEPSSDDIDLQPESGNRYNEYIEHCTAKLNEECGEEIYKKLVEKKEGVSDHCCHNLVEMGKPCNEELLKVLTSLPEYKPYKAEIIQRGRKVWDQCASLVGVSPTS